MQKVIELITSESFLQFIAALIFLYILYYFIDRNKQCNETIFINACERIKDGIESGVGDIKDWKRAIDVLESLYQYRICESVFKDTMREVWIAYNSRAFTKQTA